MGDAPGEDPSRSGRTGRTLPGAVAVALLASALAPVAPAAPGPPASPSPSSLNPPVAALHAQETGEGGEDDQEEERARVLARADSIRASLVRPPGSPDGVTAMDVIRLPFHFVGGVLGVLAIAGGETLRLARGLGLDPVSLLEDGDDGGGGFGVGADFIGSRSGPAAVVGWEGAGGVYADAAYSYRGYQRYRAGLEVGDSLAGASVEGRYHRLRALHFWGVGSGTDAADRSDLALDRFSVLAGGSLRVAGPLILTPSLGFEHTGPGRGSDAGRPDAVDVFAGQDLYGLTETTRYLRAGGGVRIPWLTVRDNQPRGAHLSAGYTWFHGVSGTESGFHRVEADLRGYLPVSPRHSLAFRALGEDHLGEEGRGVPVPYLAELGDDDGLRGYGSRRFRGRAMAALSAEWRWRVWWHPGLAGWRGEGFAFADYGGIGPSLTALESADFELTPGMGLRITRAGAGLAEGYVAFGGEGARFDASFGVTF